MKYVVYPVGWLLLLGVGSSLTAQAGGIYKCTGGSEVVYQSFPCAMGQREDPIAPIVPTVLALTDSAKQVPSSGISQPTMVSAQSQSVRPSLPFQRTVLTLGMTDDEVLNLPNWGRPARITRSRANRVWHEQWFYNGKRLDFENAKLTAIEDEPAPSLQMATSTMQE